MAKYSFRRAAKYLLASAAIFAAVSVLALLYAFVALGEFTPIYVFNANYTIGVLIIFVGIFSLLSPSDGLGGSRSSGSRGLLVDYKTHQMLKKAYHRDEPKILKFICTGAGIIVITALTQFLLDLILI